MAWDEKWLAFFAIYALGNAVEAIAGFGSTLLAVSLGALLFPIEDLLLWLVPLNMILSAILVARNWQWINRKELSRRILPWVGIGVVLGLAIFEMASGRFLKIGYGCVVTLLASIELIRTLRTSARHAPLSPWSARVALFAGGVMQGLYASGGPFVVYHCSRALPDKHQFRATLSALWLILNLVIALTYAATGKLSGETLKVSAILIIPLLAGTALGMWGFHKISERKFRISAYVLLLLGGLSLVFRSS